MICSLEPVWPDMLDIPVPSSANSTYRPRPSSTRQRRSTSRRYHRSRKRQRLISRPQRRRQTRPSRLSVLMLRRPLPLPRPNSSRFRPASLPRRSRGFLRLRRNTRRRWTRHRRSTRRNARHSRRSMTRRAIPSPSLTFDPRRASMALEQEIVCCGRESNCLDGPPW